VMVSSRAMVVISKIGCFLWEAWERISIGPVKSRISAPWKMRTATL